MALTQIERDRMYKKVMEGWIPDIANRLKAISQELLFMNQYTIISELHDKRIISDKVFYNTLINFGLNFGVFNKEEATRYAGIVEEMFGGQNL